MRVRDAFARALRALRARPWSIVGFAVLITLVGFVFEALAGLVSSFRAARVAIGVIAALYTTIVSVRFYYRALERPLFDFAFSARVFFTLLIAQLVALVVTVVGLALLLVPGVWIGIRLSLLSYPVVVEELGLVASLRRAWRVTDGRFWIVLRFRLATLVPFLVFGFVLAVLALAARMTSGTVALVFGLAFAAALVVLALVYVLLVGPVLSLAEASLYRALAASHKAHKERG